MYSDVIKLSPNDCLFLANVNIIDLCIDIIYTMKICPRLPVDMHLFLLLKFDYAGLHSTCLREGPPLEFVTPQHWRSGWLRVYVKTYNYQDKKGRILKTLVFHILFFIHMLEFLSESGRIDTKITILAMPAFIMKYRY